LFVAVLFTASGNLFSQTYINTLEFPDSSGIWINTQYTDTAFSHSGNKAALTDSLNPYGLGVEMKFPEAVKNHNADILLTGFILSDTIAPDALYVVTVENKGEIAFWQGVPLSKLLKEKRKWFAFSDSIVVPADVTRAGKLKIYLWNAGRQSRVLVDDLSIAFKLHPNPSFLKDVDIVPATISKPGQLLLFQNNFYSISAQPDVGFRIQAKSGDTLMDDLSYFINSRIKGEDFKKIVRFSYKGASVENGKALLKFEAKNKLEKIKLTLTCHDYSPVIDVAVTRKFRKPATVMRSALLLKYRMPLQEVYRANRKSDNNNFRDEYWLDKQGFVTGNDTTALAIYHTPGLSSIQLNTKTKLAVLNLDYKNDHPYLQFPFNADTFDLKVDESTSVYRRRAVISSSFKIYAGFRTESLPRFMKNPEGFVATYIWTEHADWGDIRTHRATYFGSEKITNADSASGGFVKYNIPVTKSVFYDNPDSITNTMVSDSLFTSLESSIVTDTNFKDFLYQVYNKGSEICLHTPEQFTTTPGQLENALKYMKNHFGSPSWIDHGYNNLPQNNREDFVCSGVQNYASGLWKKYGIRYFWNPWYEDYQTFKNLGFFGSIEKYYSGFGDFYPHPDFWQHPTRTEAFWHWPTYSVLYIEREDLWEYFFSEHQFHVFTDNWGVEINHCYPAWSFPGKGFWKFDANGTIVAMDGFNRTLQRMSDYRAEGLLNVTTVKQFLDYQLATGQIDYDVLPDGRIKITNKSSRAVKGLSFATRAKYVLVNGLKPAQKLQEDDLIFWFDLNAGAYAIIRVIE